MGVFWQDGVSQTMFAYFINQGMIMRFLWPAARERDGRKASPSLILVLMFLQHDRRLRRRLARPGDGRHGHARRAGTIRRTSSWWSPHCLCQPGVFGFVMAARHRRADVHRRHPASTPPARWWSTTSGSPTSSPTPPDEHYLKVARIVTIAAALVGMALVPVFASFESIYHAHGAFTASITPPMAVVVILAICWKRYSTTGGAHHARRRHHRDGRVHSLPRGHRAV